MVAKAVLVAILGFSLVYVNMVFVAVLFWPVGLLGLAASYAVARWSCPVQIRRAMAVVIASWMLLTIGAEAQVGQLALAHPRSGVLALSRFDPTFFVSRLYLY